MLPSALLLVAGYRSLHARSPRGGGPRDRDGYADGQGAWLWWSRPESVGSALLDLTEVSPSRITGGMVAIVSFDRLQVG